MAFKEDDDEDKQICWYYKEDEEPEIDLENFLAHLLSKDIVFLNTHWWEDDWPEKAKKTISIIVNCNDIFAWACADGEELLGEDDIDTFWQYYSKDPDWGPVVWCIRKRNMLPQKPVYDDIQKDGIWDLDKMKGLDLNWYDELSKNQK